MDRDGVVHGGRKGVLGSKPVVDRHHIAACGQPFGDRQRDLGASQGITATVEVDHQRRALTLGPQARHSADGDRAMAAGLGGRVAVEPTVVDRSPPCCERLPVCRWRWPQRLLSRAGQPGLGLRREGPGSGNRLDRFARTGRLALGVGITGAAGGEVEVWPQMLRRGVGVEVEDLEQQPVGPFHHDVAQRPVGLDRIRLPAPGLQPGRRCRQVTNVHPDVVDRTAAIRRLVVQIEPAAPHIEEHVSSPGHRLVADDHRSEALLPKLDRGLDVGGHQVRVVNPGFRPFMFVCGQRTVRSRGRGCCSP